MVFSGHGECIKHYIHIIPYIHVYVPFPFPHSPDRRVRKVLIDSGIHRPQSLALDLEAGFMYWVDLGASNRRIERARLDGSDRIQLFIDLPNIMVGVVICVEILSSF